MLLQRIATALVLLGLMVPALLMTSPWPFGLLLALMVGAATWEWARLQQTPWLGMVASVLVVVAIMLMVVQANDSQAQRWSASWLWPAVAVFWTLGAWWVLRGGQPAWAGLGALTRQCVGPLLIGAGGVAVLLAHRRGLSFMASIFALVWAADIAAYFGGKAFGRRKLAPTISPGKSWEGVWSGWFAVLLLAVACVWALPNSMSTLFSEVWMRMGWLGLTIASTWLVAMSVIGDLFESLVKRHAGAKDSSQLLPGHGGVLDRIDALLPVFPCALALVGALA